MIEKIISKMINYFKGDPKRIHHFLKVYALASSIAMEEEVDEKTLNIIKICAVTHDIGIRISEEKYGSSSGLYQQKEGPFEAYKLLSSLGIDNDIIERVCYLISVHHTYTGIDDSIDYRIIIEADFLVNAYEDNMSKQTIKSFAEKNFRTNTGISYIEKMFSVTF